MASLIRPREAATRDRRWPRCQPRSTNRRIWSVRAITVRTMTALIAAMPTTVATRFDRSRPGEREGEPERGTSDRPAQVGPPIQVRRQQHVDHDVDHDDLDHGAHGHGPHRGVPPPVVHGEHRAEDAEDRARRARAHGAEVAEGVRGRAGGQSGQQVEQGVARAAELSLQDVAQDEQRVRVDGKVEDTEVQEHRGEQPPCLSVGHQGREHGPQVDHDEQVGSTDERAEASPGHLQDVDGEQDHHDRIRDRNALRVGDRDPPPGSLPEFLPRFRDARGALVADRGGDHALGADGAVAPGAVHAGLDVGVAVARLGRRRRRRDDRSLFHQRTGAMGGRAWSWLATSSTSNNGPQRSAILPSSPIR